MRDGFHHEWRHHDASLQAAGVSQSKHEMSELTVLLDVAMIKSVSWQSSICTALEGSRVGQNALKLIGLL